MNPTSICFDGTLSDFNISNITFEDGNASTSNIKYTEVGVIKILLQDYDWTGKDQNKTPSQCNSNIDPNLIDNNLSGDGLIDCNVKGTSTQAIVFKPAYFEFTTPTITEGANNFTYMIPSTVTNTMFGSLETTIISKNSAGDTTRFFEDGCFANDVNITLDYNATQKDITSSNMVVRMRNDNNLSNPNLNQSIGNSSNLYITSTFDNNFSSGIAPLKILITLDRNDTAMQPVLLTPNNLKGTVTDYRDIGGANVTDISGTTLNPAYPTLHFYYGRVHAPDYRFAGPSGIANIFYEVYCENCTNTDRIMYDINGSESADSINWYINENHKAADGSVSTYSTVDDATFGGSSTTTSGTITNGIESITVNAPKISGVDQLPYIDKVEMNSTNWITFDPKDFIIEFQDQADDWAGQGQLGHIIDTNVSKRSNRRLDW